MAKQYPTFLDERAIHATIATMDKEDKGHVREVLQHAVDPNRKRFDLLPMSDLAALMAIKSPDLTQELFAAAQNVKERVYGKRVVFFQPLYFTNECVNECRECAFRKANKELTRRTLTQDDIREETKALVHQGQKRVLLIGGESTRRSDFETLCEYVNTIYSVREPKGGQIWRVNVNVAPLSVKRFRELNATGIGTYQLFQETYHKPTYDYVHEKGIKSIFDWRLYAFHRAMEAGIGDIGMGVQLGLYDWRYDVLAMHQHIASLEKEYKTGCHTISVPRTEPALGSDMSKKPPFEVSNDDFKKIFSV